VWSDLLAFEADRRALNITLKHVRTPWMDCLVEVGWGAGALRQCEGGVRDRYQAAAHMTVLSMDWASCTLCLQQHLLWTAPHQMGHVRTLLWTSVMLARLWAYYLVHWGKQSLYRFVGGVPPGAILLSAHIHAYLPWSLSLSLQYRH
jgi:hypothetical protein